MVVVVGMVVVVVSGEGISCFTSGSYIDSGIWLQSAVTQHLHRCCCWVVVVVAVVVLVDVVEVVVVACCYYHASAAR